MITMVNRLARTIHRRMRTMWALVNARRTSLRRLAREPVHRVLIVCYGNIYRSAFVGEFLRRELGGSIEIRSAGFHPVTGRPSPDKHIRMCAPLGVDLSSHRSAIVQRSDIEWADTIILMDRHNWAALDALGLDSSKCVWLGALEGQGREIKDPYNLSDEAAQRVIEQMHRATQALVKTLRDNSLTKGVHAPS